MYLVTPKFFRGGGCDPGYPFCDTADSETLVRVAEVARNVGVDPGDL